MRKARRKGVSAQSRAESSRHPPLQPLAAVGKGDVARSEAVFNNEDTYYRGSSLISDEMRSCVVEEQHSRKAVSAG